MKCVKNSGQSWNTDLTFFEQTDSMERLGGETMEGKHCV